MRHVPHCKIPSQGKLFCDTCSMSKIHKLSFPTSTHVSTFPFELIHIDIWGPYRVHDINGASFFLTKVDDFSKTTWTYLLHTKGQVPFVISIYLAYIKNHFNSTPKTIRSDNGIEFFNSTCAQLFHKLGILHKKSMVDTPQQNGVVEKKHRHLLETARSL